MQQRTPGEGPGPAEEDPVPGAGRGTPGRAAGQEEKEVATNPTNLKANLSQVTQPEPAPRVQGLSHSQAVSGPEAQERPSPHSPGTKLAAVSREESSRPMHQAHTSHSWTTELWSAGLSLQPRELGSRCPRPGQEQAEPQDAPSQLGVQGWHHSSRHTLGPRASSGGLSCKH